MPSLDEMLLRSRDFKAIKDELFLEVWSRVESQQHDEHVILERDPLLVGFELIERMHDEAHGLREIDPRRGASFDRAFNNAIRELFRGKRQRDGWVTTLNRAARMHSEAIELYPNHNQHTSSSTTRMRGRQSAKDDFKTRHQIRAALNYTYPKLKLTEREGKKMLGARSAGLWLANVYIQHEKVNEGWTQTPILAEELHVFAGGGVKKAQFVNFDEVFSLGKEIEITNEIEDDLIRYAQDALEKCNDNKIQCVLSLIIGQGGLPELEDIKKRCGWSQQTAKKWLQKALDCINSCIQSEI